MNTAVSYVAGFAIGAGLDILGRIAIALGIDQQLGPLQTIELILIVGFAIVAIGSLTLTIATLSTAPQVIAWARLAGLLAPPIRPGVDPPRAPHVPARLVSIPMQLGACSPRRRSRSSARPAGARRCAGLGEAPPVCPVRQTPSSSSRSSSIPR